MPIILRTYTIRTPYCNTSLFYVLFFMFFTFSGITKCSVGNYITTQSLDKKFTCGTRSTYRCRDGKCISSFLICDGPKDCEDGSDEAHAVCFHYKCPKGTFRCAYGGCVDGDKKCNGVPDCADGSDELNLECQNFVWTNSTHTCRSQEFQCRSGSCISKFSVCDGLTDCDDGSDETITHCNQPNFMCQRGTFRCAYGACIEGDTKCDGRNDCADGSDEDPILCDYPADSFRPTSTTRRYVPHQNTPSTTELVMIQTRPTTATTTTTQTWRPPETEVSESAVSCRFPQPAPGTTYILTRCNCTVPFVRQADLIQVKCAENYTPRNDDYSFVFCIGGQLQPRDHKCHRKCEPLKSYSVKYTCTHGSENVDCRKRVRYQTVATVKCATGYVADSDYGILPYEENRCQEDGKWQYEEFNCKAECGKMFDSVSVVPQISYGTAVTNISEYPWHVAIYSSKDSRPGKAGTWQQICGGTIITEHFILTAAHCVDDGTTVSELVVFAGKYYRDYYVNEHGAQRLTVAKIHVHGSYRGINEYYKYDIAILELATAVRFSATVMPACIVLDKRVQQKHYSLTSKIGFIAGWGLDEFGMSTNDLRSAVLPYITRDECIARFQEVENKIAEDKFCAFNTNGTSVLQGDSGGGLTFQFSRRHFVFGIVSVKINTTFVNISAFTDLTHESNMVFVQNAIIEFDKKHILG